MPKLKIHDMQIRSAALLGAFAVLGVGLVVIIHTITQPIIAYNLQLSLLHQLQALVPPNAVDNDMANDVLRVQAPTLLGTDSSVVYRGRKQGKPVAVVVNSEVPEGYAGPIKLLVAIGNDGIVQGVTVLSHKETPGLGDQIEPQRSNWIFGFNGKSLQDPLADAWEVRRDGGAFDQLTGATVTSRAMVRAVKKALIFTQQHGERLYGATADH